MKGTLSIILATALIASPAAAKENPPSGQSRTTSTKVGICEKLGGVAVAAGAAAAATKAAASTFGVAAVAHSSGTALLTSVGAGGTGYIAGTLGGIGATALAALSSPVVIVVGATAAVAGGGAVTYCYMKNHRRTK